MYESLQASVRRLITRFGRSITLQQHSTTAGTDPWKGDQALADSSTVDAVEADLLGDEAVQKWLEQEDFRLATNILLVAEPTDGFVVRETTQVVDGSITYGVQAVKALKPGGTDLLYAIGLSQ